MLNLTPRQKEIVNQILLDIKSNKVSPEQTQDLNYRVNEIVIRHNIRSYSTATLNITIDNFLNPGDILNTTNCDRVSVSYDTQPF